MTLIVGHNGVSSYTSSITGRTIQSGGSIGGDNKPGIVTFGTSWQRRNMGNYIRRAPQRLHYDIYTAINGSNNQVQGTRYQVFAMRTLG
jgi:hypothetical protein